MQSNHRSSTATNSVQTKSARERAASVCSSSLFPQTFCDFFCLTCIKSAYNYFVSSSVLYSTYRTPHKRSTQSPILCSTRWLCKWSSGKCRTVTEWLRSESASWRRIGAARRSRQVLQQRQAAGHRTWSSLAESGTRVYRGSGGHLLRNVACVAPEHSSIPEELRGWSQIKHEVQTSHLSYCIFNHAFWFHNHNISSRLVF